MARCWFIGSTTVDVIIYLDHLPKTAEDITIKKQIRRLGGCAHNSYHSCRHLTKDARLVSSLGTGPEAQWIKEQLKEALFLPRDEENGCCYCLVDQDKERTFLSILGAENHFAIEELLKLDIHEDDIVYLSGIEIEANPRMPEVIAQKKPGTFFFAPGPRLKNLTAWDEIFSLHPLFHLSENEACALAGQTDVFLAAETLYNITNRPVIVTRGKNGAFVYDQDIIQCPAFSPKHIIDTIGAGDSHAGVMVYALSRHMPWPKALRLANRYACLTLETAGAILPDEQFNAHKEEFL